jgi:hypothetical protein
MRAIILIKGKDLEAENAWCEQNLQHGGRDFFSSPLKDKVNGKFYWMGIEMTPDLAPKLKEHFGNNLKIEADQEKFLKDVKLDRAAAVQAK